MKLLYGILLLGLSSVLVMGQTMQISFSQNTSNDLGTRSEQNTTSTQAESDIDQLGQAASNDTVGWQTYQDSQNGFKIEYPPGWSVEEPVSTGITVGPDDESADTLGARTGVSVGVQDASQTLDPNTLQVTSLPPEHFAKTFIQGMTLMEGSGIDTIKDEAITFAGEPAWQVEYITDYQGIQVMYGKSIFVVKDGKLFDIGFTTEPLKVPEMRPIGEKIVQSFQFTNSTAP